MSTLAVIKDLQQRMSASIIGQEEVVKNLVIGQKCYQDTIEHPGSKTDRKGKRIQEQDFV